MTTTAKLPAPLVTTVTITTNIPFVRSNQSLSTALELCTLLRKDYPTVQAGITKGINSLLVHIVGNDVDQYPPQDILMSIRRELEGCDR